jgi:hypothetical protein
MPPAPIRYDAANLNLASRFFRTAVVVASPALAAETIIASVATSGDIAAIDSVYVSGWASFTVGTSGTAIRLRLRQTNVAGTVIADSGPLTGGIAAAALVAQDIQGNDTAPVLPGQVYVMTLTVTAASAGSAVSAVSLWAFVA